MSTVHLVPMTAAAPPDATAIAALLAAGDTLWLIDGAPDALPASLRARCEALGIPLHIWHPGDAAAAEACAQSALDASQMVCW